MFSLIFVLFLPRYNGSLKDWDGVAIVTYALVSRGLCYFNSAMNPVIYNFMSGKHRVYFIYTQYIKKRNTYIFADNLSNFKMYISNLQDT